MRWTWDSGNWWWTRKTGVLQSMRYQRVRGDWETKHISHEVIGLDAMILSFWILTFKPAFSHSSFTLISRPLVPLCFLPSGCHLHIWDYWHFSQQSCFCWLYNPGLPHCWCILYQMSHKGSPRIPEWVAYPCSSRSSHPRNWTRVSCTAGGFSTNWAIREAPREALSSQNIPEWHSLCSWLQTTRPPIKTALDFLFLMMLVN